MPHRASTDDHEFRLAVEACKITPDEFDHRAHIRLAYVYLCDAGAQDAEARMTQSLVALLAHHDIDPAKYHVTLTRAWILAVEHFMQNAGAACRSASAFISANPALTDSRIMLTHYSAEVLFSEDARRTFVEPDIQSIPPP